MTVPLSNRLDGVLGAGASTGASGIVPVVTTRAPTGNDVMGPNGPYKVGQEWVNSPSNLFYVLTSLSSSQGQVTAHWAALAEVGGVLSSLTGDTGTATATAGNIQISGTANEISTTASVSTVNLSIPATFIAPGSISAATTITAGGALSSSSGNIEAFNGVLGSALGLNIFGIGATLKISTSFPASAPIGQSVAMTAGTVTVSTSVVTASSLIFLTNGGVSGTPGVLSVGTIVPGTSFVIHSSSSTDTSVVNYLIIN